MPRPRWERLDAERKDRILAAATAEFAAHGFDGASYNAIIAAAGISKGAMYYYFDDKLDLFVTAVRGAVGRVANAAGPLDELVPDFWSGVERMTLRSVVFAQTHPETLSLYRELLALRERRASDTVEAVIAEFLAVTHGMLALGRELGAVRDDLPEGMLEAAVNSLGEGLDRWYLEHLGPDDDPEEVARLSTDLMRRLAAPRSTT